MNNNNLRVHPDSTSRTRPQIASYAEPQAYSVAPQVTGLNQTLVTELLAANFPTLHLHCPISASVSWSGEMNCFMAIDYVFDWHGQGDSTQDALQDLADVIAEDYEDLRDWPGDLSEPLQQRLAVMKRYFENAL